tara:strand:- start:120 stop:683 length:564 start_codon:yes stop_codon:yes gene_type:complete
MKKGLVIGIIIVVIVAIVGFFLLGGSDFLSSDGDLKSIGPDEIQEIRKTIDEAPNCESIEDETIREICIGERATENADFSECDKLSSGRRACYIEIAVDSNDPDICVSASTLKIEGDTSNPQNILDYCYEEIAKKNLRPELCDEIKGTFTRDRCYKSLSLSMDDKSLCDKISNQDKVEDCKEAKLVG